MPVKEVEVLGTEVEVVEEVSVLTTVVVCVECPSVDAETVKVRVIIIVVISVGFMTPKHLVLTITGLGREPTANSCTDVVRDTTPSSKVGIVASCIRSVTRTYS